MKQKIISIGRTFIELFTMVAITVAIVAVQASVWI